MHRLLLSAGFLLALALMPAFAALTSAPAADSAQPGHEHTVEVDSQELSIRRFDAEGDQLLLWISPGFGDLTRAMQTADALAKRGIEVWHIDIAESLFLPKSSNTLRALDGRYVAGLIEAAHAETGKTVTLVSRAYGALPLLRGARIWQQRFSAATADGDGAGQRPYLSGAILFSPELYSRVPELGLAPEYDPIARATNIPIMLYQDAKRGNRWQLDATLQQLEAGGAQVLHKLLPGVTGLFFEEDTARQTLDTLETIPAELPRVIHLLGRMNMPAQVAPMAAATDATAASLDITLKPFKGNPVPAALDLPVSRGEHLRREDFRGKVTLVNFWASWCKPCVEEIPSLNHLREKMQGRAFELISVNYAEDRQHIADFLQLVQVDFPVLIDADGRVAADWNVLVFPSTFVIGPDGRIAYGVNGAIYWDSPEIVAQLEDLMKQAH